MKKPLVFLVGPTAIGKTEIALILARRINAEIISCDSMQIYKGMDIITSKPAAHLRKTVPHHLIDIASPKNEYNVSRYRREAIKKIKEIIRRGKTPLFVGGTGLYMSVLIDGIFSSKSQNKTIRQRLYSEAERRGSEYLYARLKQVDPEATARVHPNDTKRIIRALEVFQATGQPISQLQKQRKGLRDEFRIKIFCLNMERRKLYQRIEDRLERMFSVGLVNEVRRLLRLKLSKTASCAIGVKEIKGYLEGLYDLEEAKRLLQRNTCLYAKRQLTWFRKDKHIKWINISDKEKPQAVAIKIWKKLF